MKLSPSMWRACSRSEPFLRRVILQVRPWLWSQILRLHPDLLRHSPRVGLSISELTSLPKGPASRRSLRSLPRVCSILLFLPRVCSILFYHLCRMREQWHPERSQGIWQKWIQRLPWSMLRTFYLRECQTH